MAEERLLQEIEQMRLDPPPRCSAGPINPRDLYRWKAVMTGPPRSPYADGMFELKLVFPADYPQSPPIVNFETKIYHMNVDECQGYICLDILKNAWTNKMTVAQVLLAVGDLLSHPNAEDPLEFEKAAVWQSNKGLYSQTAQEWTLKYAKPYQKKGIEQS